MREPRAVQKKRMQLLGTAHPMERVLDTGRTHKPVVSVLSRSLKFDMAKLLTCVQRSRWRSHKLPVACTRINNKPSEHQPSWQRKRDQRVQQQPQQNRRSFHQIANETHVMRLSWKTGST